jgi:hypothetical protein
MRAALSYAVGCGGATKAGALILLPALFFMSMIQDSAAQSAPPPIPVQPNIAALQAQGHVFTMGESCQRMSGGSGLVKRDACGRWYCSRREYQDITERRPNYAAELGCEWRLVGMRCLCQRPAK